jgi:hypothetical protein
MQGGRVIGEGVDGCIITEPMWPCSANSIKSDIPPLKSDGFVSKITHKGDDENIFRLAAQEILGPLATKYLTILQSECSPSDPFHPSTRSQSDIYKESKASLLAWTHKGQACGDLKDIVKKGKSISEDHKIMYISRYDASLKDWLSETKDSMNKVTLKIIPAIREFLGILQMLHQGSKQKLIHIDLHIGNIFVKQAPIQFGLTDFGHCLLRRISDTPEQQAKMYFGHYLCEYIEKYDIIKDYRQVPFEARLLNFCYRKNLEKVSPGSLVTLWEAEIQSIKAESSDLIIMESHVFIKNLLKKPLFISMVEILQKISKKLRLSPVDRVRLVESLDSKELIVLEYILTRYNCISPINSITEAILSMETKPPVLEEVRETVESYFYGRRSSSVRTKISCFIEFLTRAIMAPYEHGSSISAAMISVTEGDIRIIWDASV